MKSITVGKIRVCINWFSLVSELNVAQNILPPKDSQFLMKSVQWLVVCTPPLGCPSRDQFTRPSCSLCIYDQTLRWYWSIHCKAWNEPSNLATDGFHVEMGQRYLQLFFSAELTGLLKPDIPNVFRYSPAVYFHSDVYHVCTLPDILLHSTPDSIARNVLNPVAKALPLPVILHKQGEVHVCFAGNWVDVALRCE